MAKPRLPLIVLSPCACGHQGQGTRARPGVSVPCTKCRTRRRVPMARPLDGSDDPAALPYARRGQSFQAGNPWRFQGGTRARQLESQAAEVCGTPVPPAARTVPVMQPKVSQAQRTIEDYVTAVPGMTAGSDPLPFSLPIADMSCTGCVENRQKNSKGRYNRAGVYVKVSNSQTGQQLLEGNFCKSCYLKVLQLWSQHRTELRFRFSTELRPGI